jgi:hypothetical protein
MRSMITIRAAAVALAVAGIAATAACYAVTKGPDVEILRAVAKRTTRRLKKTGRR